LILPAVTLDQQAAPSDLQYILLRPST